MMTTTTRQLRTLTLIGALALTSACGSNSPTAPSTPPPPPPPQIPACQANHTASMTFGNRGSATINVVLDGGNVGVLSPQSTGLTSTVAAGVAHSVVFRLTNTTLSLCSAFNPIPVECSSQTYSSCLYQ